MTKIISKSEIISAIAYWGIRQSPYIFPSNFQIALIALNKRIDDKKIFETTKKNTLDSYLEIEQDKIVLLIEDLIFNTPEIALWNITKMEQDKGIKSINDENRTIKNMGTSRYGTMQSEDMSFIDLDALRQNVCKTICE